MLPYDAYQQLLIDVTRSRAIALEYGDKKVSYTRPVSLGADIDAREALRRLDDEEAEETIRQMRAD